jgi:hypothetical protein
LERHQLEDCGGALPGIARRRVQRAQGIHLSYEMESENNKERHG